MRTKNIDTLAQLREAKAQLKLKMKMADQEAKDSVVFSFINNLFAKKSKKKSLKMDEGTLNAIKYVASQDDEDSKFLKIIKPIISIGITIVAPIIARKIGKYNALRE